MPHGRIMFLVGCILYSEGSKTMKNRIISCILSMIVFLSLSGCDILNVGYDDNKYSGIHPHLFTEAVYSLLGITGSASDKIEILENDNYGRTLFSYFSPLADVQDSPDEYDEELLGLYSVMVCQYTENESVGFYPDENFIVKQKSDVSDDEIETLKTANDWN